MLILAIYYTIADIVLLGQCFYYRGFTWRDEVVPPAPKPRRRTRQSRAHGATGGDPNGHTILGSSNNNNNGTAVDERTSLLARDRERRGSDWSERLTHLNPVVPIVDPAAAPPPPSTGLQNVAWNTVVVLMVIAAGVAGWLLSRGYGGGGGGDADPTGPDHDGAGRPEFDLWGQVFGWLCALLYLGSRLPQLLLNWRRKSTEGVSMLFFLFACLGNLTYVLSIMAYDPGCSDGGGDDDAAPCGPGEAAGVYGRYVLVNLSWLAGSFGTLLLDMGIFVQFFIYSTGRDEDGYADDDDGAVVEEGDESDERSIDGDRWDQRPVLERSQSEWSN